MRSIAVSVHLPASETQWGRTPLGQAPTPSKRVDQDDNHRKYKISPFKGHILTTSEASTPS